MIKKILRVFFVVLGMIVGAVVGNYIIKSVNGINLFSITLNSQEFAHVLFFGLIFSLLFGAISFVLTPLILKVGIRLAEETEKELRQIPISEILLGVVGLIIGLAIAFLVSNIYDVIPIKLVSNILTVITYIFLAYLGITLATRSENEIYKLPTIIKYNMDKKDSTSSSPGKDKILDTSVIIDGRIADISKTGFIEGAFIIPEFVLEELQFIADSSDDLKRIRGRRGLDILTSLREESEIIVKIVDDDFDDISEVDIKLLKLAQKRSGVVLTNDYNLNKVAGLHDVQVLNINELANAVKPVVIPGETMEVTVVKKGKEKQQGLAYLDDGTMIVVENGEQYIEKTINVLVTSVLQTAAGRMIFARPN